MARTVGIDFKFSGDATKAVAAFKQIAAAASAAGGDTAKAGKELERALRKAEEQASARNKSLREAAGGAGKTGAGSFLAGLADSLGLGTFADQFGGVENVLDGISTKAAVAATGAAALGAVLVKLGVDSFNTFKTVVEQVDAVADVTGSSAEEASKLVGVFKGVGIDATAGASAMAKLAKAVGTNEAGLLKYGIVVARNADGTANLNGTLLNVASAYQATTDPAERAALASAVFGKSWAEMVDVLEKSRSKISELQGLAPGVTDDDIKRLEEYKQATAGFGQAWTDSKLGVGRQLISLTTAELERFTGVASVAGSIVTGDLGGAWDKLFNDTKQASTAFRDASDDLGGRMVAAALQASFAVRNLGGEVELASARAARAASVFAALFDRQTTAISAQVRFKDAIFGLQQVQQQAAGNATKYADAQNDVARAVGDQSKAASDAARKIADAERQAAERIVDAQQRVSDARDAASKSAQSAADRVLDAERALVDAAASGAGDNPLDQQRRIEDAQIDLERARRDQAQAGTEGAKDVQRAEEDLFKAQQDGARDVSDARREAAEAQASAAERVADAQNRANTSYDVGAVSVGNMTGKVDDLVKSTYDAAFQTQQLGGSQADVKAKVDESIRALEEYGPQLGLTSAQIEYYRKQLQLIPAMIPTRIRVDFSVGSVTDVARRGLAAAAASVLQIPQFAGGGTFRASGGGAGLAVLHDGEKVLTPEQQRQGGVTINVYGSVMSDRDLVETIGRAYRQGFRGD